MTTAERRVARDYERLKPEVLRSVRVRLARRGVHADETDLEAFYNQAWHAIYARLREGHAVERPHALLVTIAERRAIDEARALRLERGADPDRLQERWIDPDLAARLDARRQLRQFTEGLRDRLSERERQAAMLCYVHGYARPAAARALGVSPRRMEKIMDRVSKKVGALVRDIERGHWCESRASLIKAYALGLLDVDGARHLLAVAHLEDCAACRRRVLEIRGIAALAPPAPALLALAGAGLGGGVASARRLRPRSTTVAAAGAASVVAVAALAAVVERPPDTPSDRAVRVAPPPPPAAAERTHDRPAPRVAETAQRPKRATRVRKRASKRPSRRRAATATRAVATTMPAPTPRATIPAPPAPTHAPPAPTPAPPSRTPAPPAPARDYDGAGEFELR